MRRNLADGKLVLKGIDWTLMTTFMRKPHSRLVQRLIGGVDTFLPRESAFERDRRRSDATHAPHLANPLEAKWLNRGARQFELLQQIGLQPQHRFLDFGCAYLATARYVVPYLEPMNYVGVDVGRLIMARGVRRLTALGIERRRFHIAHASSPDLEELHGFKFDFIWAYAVMHFINPRDFATVVRRFSDLSEGVICVSQSSAHMTERRRLHQYDVAHYQELLPGFRLEQYEFPRGQRAKKPILVFRR